MWYSYYNYYTQTGTKGSSNYYLRGMWDHFQSTGVSSNCCSCDCYTCLALILGDIAWATSPGKVLELTVQVMVTVCQIVGNDVGQHDVNTNCRLLLTPLRQVHATGAQKY